MIAQWVTRAIPDPTTCLKLPLRPYALGHELLLLRIESQFVQEGCPDLSALVLACLICSQDFHSAEKALRSRWLKTFCLFWGWRCRKLNFGEEVLRFIAYRSAGLWHPPINQIIGGERKTRKLKAPVEFGLLHFLMHDLHLAYDAAMNFPMAIGHELWATAGDRNDELDLSGGAEEEALSSALARFEKEGLL